MARNSGMKLSDEIRELQNGSGEEAWNKLQKVLDALSERGRKAGLAAVNKSRGDSNYYSEIAKKRWAK